VNVQTSDIQMRTTFSRIPIHYYLTDNCSKNVDVYCIIPMYANRNSDIQFLSYLTLSTKKVLW